MLQRIQTVYMLIVAALMATLCFVPMATYTIEGTSDCLRAFDFWWIGVLFAACALLPFVAIWLYKKRLVQVRLLCVEIVLLAGAQIFATWYSIGFGRTVAEQSSVAMSSITTPTFFPVACIILVWLAIRAIWKDERLVRSLDRIR